MADAVLAVIRHLGEIQVRRRDMHTLTAKLILYSNLPEDSILMRLSGIYADWTRGETDKSVLIHRCYTEIKRLLDLSTVYGFDHNLWHNYLTFLMIDHENSFSLTCELTGASDGSINRIAQADFEVFRQLFAFDFGPMERDLGIDCFSVVSDYKAIPKKEQMYNRSVSEKVRALSLQLAAAPDAETVFRLVCDHYRTWGVGLFGLNRAFRIKPAEDGVDFLPINNIDRVLLSDLIGYELQKAQVRENILGFIEGRGYNNMLLYGDAGTGKSTTVKAVLNEYADRGLRIIEIYKHQFDLLSEVIARIKNRHYFFIIFIDDLSFEDTEVEYKFLKAVIEGGIETRPDNVMICATSNRRHLIKETWNDRNDMAYQGDIHHSDTMEEKLSLAARFGCTVGYDAPTPVQYREIVKGIAARYPGIDLSEEELIAQAHRWELRHGGLSGRTAQQFINHIAGTLAEK